MIVRERSRRSKRIAQGIFGMNLVLMLIGTLLVLDRGFDIPASEGGIWALWPLSAGLHSLLGLLIVSRHPGHKVGWIFVLIGFLTALISFSFGFSGNGPPATSNMILRFLGLLGESFWIIALTVPLTLVLQFFPDGRLPSRRWRPVTLATLLGMAGVLAGQMPGYFDLTGSEGFFDLLEVLTTVFMATAVIGSLAAVVVRFRRSSGIERTQMKWLVYTAVVTISLLVGMLLLLDDEHPLISIYVISLPSVLALSIGIAILRHRLFDIDIIIRRTAQYAVVTGLLALVYFGTVIIMQGFFTAIGGQQSPVFIVMSTLAVAALFNPIRNRVQEVIDRRFFRSKYDAERALAQFAVAARDEVDLDHLAVALMNVVQETMQPEKVQVWLRLDEGKDRRAINRAREGIHENI